MAKLAGAVTRAYARPLAMPLALVALLAAPGARADWSFTPLLELRETYTDNVALRADNEKQSQFVSEIAPGFLLRHKGARVDVNANFQLQYFALQDKDVSGTNRTAKSGQGELRARLIDDLLYVDATGSISQQGISPFGPQPGSSGNYVATNRAEVRTWRVSPYLVHRFGPTASAELRYAHDEVDAGRIGLGNSSGDSLQATISSGTAFRKTAWSLQASDQTIHDELATDSRIQAATATGRYRVSNTFNLAAALGYDKYDYQSLGGATSGASWNVGFLWTPSLRTSLKATTGRRFYGASHTLAASHRSRHTVWSINYDDAVTSTRANFLLPATIDTAGMLDRLFMPTFSDPAERARAVEDYIRTAGLPPSLADNLNFFSNRYSLQKQLRASVAYKQGRTSAVYAIYHVRREALSVRAADNPLLGAALNNANDDVSQSGFNASLNYRLTPRTFFNLVSDIGRAESLSTGERARTSAVRLSVRHQMRAKLAGVLEVRRVTGNTAFVGGQPYTENAVAASISMQL